MSVLLKLSLLTVIFYILAEPSLSRSIEKSSLQQSKTPTSCCNDKQIRKMLDENRRKRRCISTTEKLLRFLIKLNNVYCEIDITTNHIKGWSKYNHLYEFLPKMSEDKSASEWFHDLNYYLFSFDLLKTNHICEELSEKQRIEVIIFREKARALAWAMENLVPKNKRNLKQFEDGYMNDKRNSINCLNQRFTMFYFREYLAKLCLRIGQILGETSCCN